MRRLALVLTVALLMVAMLASALPAMAASGPPCGTATGLATAHASVPEGNPAHEHIPCA